MHTITQRPLIERRVELVFDPFDLERITVRVITSNSAGARTQCFPTTRSRACTKLRHDHSV
jgi:hypothetical protein